MHMPLVSCICPTYNRPPDYQHLIEEAIQCFLLQDYPNKEMLVLNDTPGQELYCEAEGVTIMNFPRRFRTLGEKRNAGVAMSKGEVIAPWDDDDINLPWRLSYSIARLGNSDYYNPRRYWAWWLGKLLPEHGYSNGLSAGVFTRTAFELVGGYKFITAGEDHEMDLAIRSKLVNIVDESRDPLGPLPRNKWFYMTRYGSSPCHVSLGDHTDSESMYQIIGQRPTEKGRFNLNPHWRLDYVEETRPVLEGIGEKFEPMNAPLD